MFQYFDCQPWVVVVAMETNYNYNCSLEQSSPPIQVCSVCICVCVCVQTSISDRPCVWSGTEPVIRGKLTQSFSTLCFLMFHFSPSLSLSASLACSFHLCLSFSDTDSAWLSVSVCLAGFSFNQSVSQSVWLSVYVFDLSLLSASWVACYFLLAFELFFFIIIKHTDNITQFHIRNANKTRIKSTTVSKSAS